ncbi:MAG: PEP-CTERM sorting domain-containing protein [Verrucomicrobiaceae bacterium]|nr:MAG: PEP-CTERM sorting domain-containing protein [Verrucomicrobiaceae bacterium]
MSARSAGCARTFPLLIESLMKFLPPLSGILLSIAPLHAATVLVKYDFEGNSMSPSISTQGVLTGNTVSADIPNTTGTTSTTHDLRRWFFSNASGSSSKWGNTTPLIRVQRNVVDLATAVTGDSYFSITLNPGDDVELTTISLDIGTTQPSGFPFGMTIRSSVTGTTNLLSVDANGQVPANVGVDLTAYPQFAALENPVTFYFYLYEYSGSNTLNFYADNITFSGVPEPTSAALGGLAAAGLLVRRRRA